MSDYIINPYVNILKMEQRNKNYIYTNFNCIYIICAKNIDNINIDIYKYYIDSNLLNEYNNNLILIKSSNNLLKNINNINHLILIPKNFLSKINIFNYELNENNLCLLILNITYDNLKLYLKQFEETEIDELIKLITMNKYFNYSLNYKSIKYIENLINFESSSYWSNPYNLKITLNDAFKDRKYNLVRSTNLDNNYLDLIYQTKNYTDPSSVINYNNYKINFKTNLSKEDINILFQNISDSRLRFLLFSNMLISKKYSHLVINNKFILELMNLHINKYLNLIRYLLGYTWIHFYFAESIKKTYTTKEDFFIFDIDTASLLPKFTFSMNNPKDNPYMPILVSDKILNPKLNIGSIVDPINIKKEGICNLNEFKERINIFTTGNIKNNLFESVDFEKDKIAISGSIMAACLQKYHPLTDMFNYLSYNDRLNRFYNEYYADADIDVMFLTSDIFDYMDKVKKFYNQIVKNICNFNKDYAEPNHVKLISNKVGYLFISEKEVMINVCDNSVEKFKEIKSTIDTEETRKLFSKIIDEEFTKFKTNILSNYLKQDLENKYPDFFNFNDIQFKVRIFDKNDKNKNIQINYKYNIVTPHLNHNIELFMIRYNDFFATVTNFHLPCVRAYYDGNTVYMTPSCISAHMTLMNIDYKYFAGSKDPIEIVNKYRMRGFGTWLNNNEITIYEKNTLNHPFWKKLYLNEQIRGNLDYKHKLFRPRQVCPEEYYNKQPIDNELGYNFNNYKIPINPKYENQLYSYLDTLTTINSDGTINELQKWIINAITSINNENNYSKIENENDNSNLENIYELDISGGYNFFH